MPQGEAISAQRNEVDVRLGEVSISQAVADEAEVKADSMASCSS